VRIVFIIIIKRRGSCIDIYIALQIRLRQACDHPFVVLAKQNGSGEDAVKVGRGFGVVTFSRPVLNTDKRQNTYL